jgi:hypothetical protein
MTDVDNPPGEITYFLNRAKTEELKEIRTKELKRHYLLTNYKLVALIDQELDKRRNQCDHEWDTKQHVQIIPKFVRTCTKCNLNEEFNYGTAKWTTAK